LSRILLVDLDDTLLNNDIDAFLPHYLKAFGAYVAEQVDPKKFTQTLLAATGMMVKNRQPDRTLREAFNAAFFPALGVEPQDLSPYLEGFYAEIFPTLRRWTTSKPEAASLIQQELERGDRLVLATNPLFPLTAILQRLEWANLPVNADRFSLIPSYETFHFVKPDPAYFAELLALLGWPEDPMVMVGDDPLNDVLAARRMGLAAFWLVQDGKTPPDGADAPTASGSLSNLQAWLRDVPAAALKPNFTSSSAMLSILRSTAAALDTIVRDISPDEWERKPAPDEWSLCEVCCHLRDVECEVNLPRLNKVLAEENPFLPGMDTDPWADLRNYNEQDGFQALREFISARLETLSLLEGLAPGDWQRPARHAIFSRTNLAELVGIMVKHDQVHVRQSLHLHPLEIPART
jgi:FMN phosphatase YigB (HAD superfamily)